MQSQLINPLIRSIKDVLFATVKTDVTFGDLIPSSPKSVDEVLTWID
jgi:hypothetical protein